LNEKQLVTTASKMIVIIDLFSSFDVLIKVQCAYLSHEELITRNVPGVAYCGRLVEQEQEYFLCGQPDFGSISSLIS
jgi:hypothetical protein